jgi:hypothetical protein
MGNATELVTEYYKTLNNSDNKLKTEERDAIFDYIIDNADICKSFARITLSNCNKLITKCSSDITHSKFGCDKQIHAIFLNIQTKFNTRIFNDHVNMLIIDYAKKEYERFEPLGLYDEPHIQHETFDEYMESSIFKNALDIPNDFKYIPPSHFCPLGTQAFTSHVVPSTLYNGTCQYWSFLYLRNRLKNTNESRNNVVKNMISTPEKTLDDLYEFIIELSKLKTPIIKCIEDSWCRYYPTYKHLKNNENNVIDQEYLDTIRNVIPVFVYDTVLKMIQKGTKQQNIKDFLMQFL